jgi:hypothetical protein
MALPNLSENSILATPVVPSTDIDAMSVVAVGALKLAASARDL